MTSEKFNEVIKSINLMLKNSTLRWDKLEQDSIDEKYNDIVLGFIQKNNKDPSSFQWKWTSIVWYYWRNYENVCWRTRRKGINL